MNDAINTPASRQKGLSVTSHGGPL
jgi:hypothetical protein